MDARLKVMRTQTGFSMVEVLVALVILLVGLLGLAGLMVQSQRSEMESYQRVQAITLLQDMAGRMNANRVAASCYAFTNATTGVPVLGTSAPSATYYNNPACTATQIANYYNLSLVAPYSSMPVPTSATPTAAATAVSDLRAWNASLQGAAEASGGTNVGAMIGARGCISYNSAPQSPANPGGELPEYDPQSGLPTGKILLGTGVYTISIAWQGLGDTAPAALTCGTGLYLNSTGAVDEAQRRVVSLTIRMAALTK